MKYAILYLLIVFCTSCHNSHNGLDESCAKLNNKYESFEALKNQVLKALKGKILDPNETISNHWRENHDIFEKIDKQMNELKINEITILSKSEGNSSSIKQLIFIMEPSSNLGTGIRYVFHNMKYWKPLKDFYSDTYSEKQCIDKWSVVAD